MPKLLVVGTPIGNLGDLTERTREALEKADLIAAEDTRVTLKLLNHYGLRRPLVSCHRHNEEDRAPHIVARMLAEDLTVALTCDAGTPGISDPGHMLVRACWEAGIQVEPVCGPSAVVTALSISGFDAREFAFYGFLPREKKELREKLRSLAAGPKVFVLYESPHRIVDLTERIDEVWPECRVLVCSDLTKHYERLYRGAPGEVAAALRANPGAEKGEYCLVVDLMGMKEAAPEAAAPAVSARVFLLERILEGDDPGEAAEAAKEAGYPRNEVYRARLEVSQLFEEDGPV